MKQIRYTLGEKLSSLSNHSAYAHAHTYTQCYSEGFAVQRTVISARVKHHQSAFFPKGAVTIHINNYTQSLELYKMHYLTAERRTSAAVFMVKTAGAAGRSVWNHKVKLGESSLLLDE